MVDQLGTNHIASETRVRTNGGTRMRWLGLAFAIQLSAACGSPAKYVPLDGGPDSRAADAGVGGAKGSGGSSAASGGSGGSTAGSTGGISGGSTGGTGDDAGTSLPPVDGAVQDGRGDASVSTDGTVDVRSESGGNTGAGGRATGGAGGVTSGGAGTGGSSTGGTGSGGKGTGGSATGGAGTGGTGSGGKATGGVGTGGAATGGAATGGAGTGGAGTGGAGTGGACASGTTNCSGTCANLQTDPAHCGSCGAAFCAGTCQSGVCCPAGKTNCGGTCVDLTSDDQHCGACSGGDSDCTKSGQAVRHCRTGACRLADGYLCTSDAECSSNKCDLFYADADHDGYPDRLTTGRFCTFGGTVAQSGGGFIQYISARTDVKWDCCDQHSGAYPGATAFSNWNLGVVLSAACNNALGDTNCDGRIEVDPNAIVTTACDTPDGVTCNVTNHPATSAECGVSLCGCGAPSAGGFCSLYCGFGDPGVGCR